MSKTKKKNPTEELVAQTDWDGMTPEQVVRYCYKEDIPVGDLPQEVIRALWDAVDEEFNKMFILHSDNRSGLRIYEILREHHVMQVINDIDNRLARAFYCNKKIRLLAMFLGINPQGYVARWKVQQPQVDAVVPYTIGDTNDWTLHVGPVPVENPNPEDMPHWMDVLERLSDPEAFMQWIWGVYSGEYKGRRAIYLYSEDPMGAEEGKSTVASVLGMELFGNIWDEGNKKKIPNGAYSIYSPQVVKRQSQFMWSPHENAKFTVYPDCMDTKIAMSGAFKIFNSGGRDPVSMEHKTKTAYGSVVDTKLFIHSNYAPDIRGDRAITSRLLPLTIKPWNTEKMGHIPAKDLAKHLTNELPVFLGFCKSIWQGDVVLGQATMDLLDELVQLGNEAYESTLSENFEVTKDDEDYVDANEVYRLFEVNDKDSYAVTELSKFLVSKGVTKERRQINGGRATRFHGLKANYGGTVKSKRGLSVVHDRSKIIKRSLRALS